MKHVRYDYNGRVMKSDVYNTGVYSTKVHTAKTGIGYTIFRNWTIAIAVLVIIGIATFFGVKAHFGL